MRMSCRVSRIGFHICVGHTTWYTVATSIQRQSHSRATLPPKYEGSQPQVWIQESILNSDKKISQSSTSPVLFYGIGYLSFIFLFHRSSRSIMSVLLFLLLLLHLATATATNASCSFTCLHDSECAYCSSDAALGDVELCRYGKDGKGRHCQCKPGWSGLRWVTAYNVCSAGPIHCMHGMINESL